MRLSNNHPDRGFTLIEVLIVTVLLGMVIVVLAAAFNLVLRVAPDTEYRIADARSTRGLQTWLTRDLASTPESNIISNPSYTSPGCGGAAGTNVIHLSWSDGPTFTVDYRIVDGAVVRTYCDGVSNSTISLTSAVEPTPCSASPWNGTQYSVVEAVGVTQQDLTVKNYKEIHMCLISSEADSGLNGGGGATQPIIISVASRHPASVT